MSVSVNSLDRVPFGSGVSPFQNKRSGMVSSFVTWPILASSGVCSTLPCGGVVCVGAEGLCCVSTVAALVSRSVSALLSLLLLSVLVFVSDSCEIGRVLVARVDSRKLYDIVKMIHLVCRLV